MGYELDIELDGVPPLPNRMPRNHLARARLRRQWREAVKYTVGRKRPDRPLERAHVEITLRRRGAEPDPDNLIASCKPLLDGLQPETRYRRGGFVVVNVGAGVIANDKPINFTTGAPVIRYEPAGRKGRESTHIRVIAAPAPAGPTGHDTTPPFAS